MICVFYHVMESTKERVKNLDILEEHDSVKSIKKDKGKEDKW